MSLFGQSTAGGGGLFGQNTQQNQQQQSKTLNVPTITTTGSGLFGGPQQTKLGGLSGQTQQANTGGLFGQTQQQAQPGGLFGQTQQTPTAIAPSQQAPGAGMFGQQGGLFGQTQKPTTALGGGALSTFGPSFAGSILGQTQPNAAAAGSASAAPATQPAGAYFDSLFAKTQKAGASSTPNVDDLPSLELGLGDLRQRLRKLQSKPSDRSEGKAHYLLAASGVDPGAAAKDLGLLDLQGARTERATTGYVASEVDVETYLSNLQTKTTLHMIQDGLERSLRDFDTFLEDNVEMEWDAQRKRVYQHFGIKPREASTAAGQRDAQAGFGRSRRSKAAQGNVTRGSARASTFGNTAFHRSVIGAPAKIGTHQSEFSDVDRSGDAAAGKKQDRALRDRQAKLAEKVRSLNAARLLHRPYPILAELAEVEMKSYEPHAPHVVEAYRAVIEIVGEEAEADATTLHKATAKERQFADMYLDENPNSAQSVEMRKRILGGANAFLEKQFLREVESLIAKHPHEARLGGLPDITSKIKAYIRLRSARKDLVPDNTELQQIHGEYVWAIVFYLLRSGHVNEAAKYVNDNSNQFRGIDRTFATYLNNYAASEERRITNRKLLDRCTNEYIQRSRNAPENTIDPFRMACYKVIGRIELNNRNLEGLNTDINDWIWLQFNLAREGDRTLEMAGESYGLADLQSSIREIGQKHFPKAPTDDSSSSGSGSGSSSTGANNNGSCGMFFYLQVLSGLFEDAIAYLYAFSYVDAVHFGLALAYYGLLRPSDPLSASNELRTHSVKKAPQINFGRMMGYYTRDFRAADAVSAVDYLCLISLNGDLGGEAGRRQRELCHEALRELVLETREFSKLIGDIRPDGRRILGVVEGRGPLIGLEGGDDFVNTVTLQAASFADENGRTTDSVLLYHLAGEYDAVVAIVSRALSEAISLEIGEDPMRLAQPRHDGNGQQQGQQQGTKGSLSLAAIDDPVELARTMMSMYERDAMFYRKIQDQNKVACRVLLEMSSIKSLVEGGQWTQCLDKIRSLDILPLEASGDASTIRAYASKFSSLSQPVSINLPNLIMWTIISCTRQRERLADGQFSGNEGTRRMLVEQLKQMILDLTTYTSQLRYRFPPHLHEALARASAE